MDRNWLEEFWGLLGLQVSDLEGREDIEKKHIISYIYPTDEELKRVGVTGLFLGHYIPWDGLSNALLAKAHGFRSPECVVEGAAVDYENLDNYQTGIHDYFKYLKFGFGRASDLISMHIRRERITREQGIAIIQKLDGKFPWTYLGKPIKEILDPLDISIEEFISICDKFTNKKLFKLDEKNNLVKDKEGNLVKINYDNEDIGENNNY